MAGTWKKSWVPRLWTYWFGIVVFAASVVAALLGLSEKTPLSHDVVEFLKQTPSWPLWVLLLPGILLTFAASAIMIILMQTWDKRRIDEGEQQLKNYIDEGEQQLKNYADKKANVEGELQKTRIELENIKTVFHERERMRRLDHITGIPNFLSWKDDLKSWDAQHEKGLCLILIDLDKLRWLNSRSRECADKVLRYFAQNTYSSMRRDEQIYKANADPDLAVDGVRPYGTAEMYRHYQGGDEFFFIITGDVYGAVGFVNRLAERVRSYQSDIRETILRRHLKEADINDFRLSFTAAIIPHNEPETALTNAYTILNRAKESKETRLFVVFDTSYEKPSEQRKKLEDGRERIRTKGSAAWEEDLRNQERELDININILLKAEQLFAVQ